MIVTKQYRWDYEQDGAFDDFEALQEIDILLDGQKISAVRFADTATGHIRRLVLTEDEKPQTDASGGGPLEEDLFGRVEMVARTHRAETLLSQFEVGA